MVLAMTGRESMESFRHKEVSSGRFAGIFHLTHKQNVGAAVTYSHGIMIKGASWNQTLWHVQVTAAGGWGWGGGLHKGVLAGPQLKSGQ